MTNPTILFIPSPNFWPGREGHQVQAIVDHITQGSESSVDAEFGNADNQVSAHFCVNKDGTVHQYVSESDSAWANGIVANPDLSIKWLADAAIKGINPNLLTISIEHEGVTGVPLTEAQFQSTLWLHLKLIREFHLGYDSQSIIGHFQITNGNTPESERAYCPGSAFPWQRLRSEIANALGATQVDTQKPTVDLTNPSNYPLGPGLYDLLKANGCYAVTGERSLHFDDDKQRVAIVDGKSYRTGNGVRGWYDAATNTSELLTKV